MRQRNRTIRFFAALDNPTRLPTYTRTGKVFVLILCYPELTTVLLLLKNARLKFRAQKTKGSDSRKSSDRIFPKKFKQKEVLNLCRRKAGSATLKSPPSLPDLRYLQQRSHFSGRPTAEEGYWVSITRCKLGEVGRNFPSHPGSR
jgi:hypothetical protein